ncbi:hypothetical protein M9H77_04085 [Catharanthus roseus]|uniref:Uncharacterized protein n=1 Tax=Catharanthus roseus TaxID=4058 RepID=A0ACC0CDD4_CATRO|nr:hypothetical protein M9H77_04085 [Catharanthus roseus]
MKRRSLCIFGEISSSQLEQVQITPLLAILGLAGRLTQFWLDKWGTRNGTWDIDALKAWLLARVINDLMNVSVRGEGQCERIWWKPSVKGVLDTKSTFNILCGFDKMDEPPEWKQLET